MMILGLALLLVVQVAATVTQAAAPAVTLAAPDTTVLLPYDLQPIDLEKNPMRSHFRNLGKRTPSSVLEDSLVYDNSNASNLVFRPGFGFEVADDVHMLAGGRLTRFRIAYGEATPGALVSIIILFYENTPDNQPPTPGRLIAGPFLIPGLPGGTNMITLVPPISFFLPKDIWWASAYASPTSGPILADPPSIGSSDNLFYDVDRSRFGDFGDTAPANFFLQIYLEDVETAVAEKTWSEIKSLYRH